MVIQGPLLSDAMWSQEKGICDIIKHLCYKTCFQVTKQHVQLLQWCGHPNLFLCQ